MPIYIIFQSICIKNMYQKYFKKLSNIELQTCFPSIIIMNYKNSEISLDSSENPKIKPFNNMCTFLFSDHKI